MMILMCVLALLNALVGGLVIQSANRAVDDPMVRNIGMGIGSVSILTSLYLVLYATGVL